jgi:DNA-binding sugar fermentation-stimulating protein
MAHTPALGCCGLIAPGALVWVMCSGGGKTVSQYTIYLVELADGTRICAHPTVANEVAAGLLGLAEAGPIPGLEDVRREVTVGASRFDFAGRVGARKAFIEVKSAPIADYVDCMPRDRANALRGVACTGPKMAIFPHGNKRKDGVISERAIKHARELQALAAGPDAPLCALLYLSMRTDIDRFTVSSVDATYKTAVSTAQATGVQVHAYAIRWEGRSAYLSHKLTVV